MKKLLAIIVSVVLFAFPALAFDEQPGEFKEFEFAPDRYRDLSRSIVSVVTMGTALGLRVDYVNGQMVYKPCQGFFAQHGSGVAIRAKNGNIYILTNTHVVTPQRMIVAESTNSTINTFVMKVISQFVYVGSWDEPTKVECKIVWLSSDPNPIDTAILKPIEPQVFLQPIPYGLLPIYQLIQNFHKGDAVAVVTGYRDPKEGESPMIGQYPERQWWYEARYGKLLYNYPEHFRKEALPWFNVNDITTDVKIYPGDSGSPVFMFLNGTPYLVGLARAMAYDIDPYTGVIRGYYSYFTFIDELVWRYLNAEVGLD